MIRPFAAALLLATALGARGAERPALEAPNPEFKPLNQLSVSGNACGPAALLTACGFGSERWQQLGGAVPGDDDRKRISALIRAYGLRRSSHLDRVRWTRTSGINVIDLTDVANEMRGTRWLPALRSEILILGSRETRSRLLARAHSRLSRSLRKGFPPIVSLQRLARRPDKEMDANTWRVVHGHYLVVIGLPAGLAKGEPSFPVRYADPWGGRILEGTIAADVEDGYPALLAVVPDTKVGLRSLKSGEESIVTLAAVLGAF